MKKGFISFIIILLFAGFIFYLGFVSFRVPVGKYGVMTSKTSGVYQKIIENEKFCWRWEKVIPKNAEIYVFEKKSCVFEQSFSGELPSGKIYSSLVKGEPDFSYSFDFEIYLSVKPENLIQLVDAQNLTGQKSLEEYLQKISAKISQELSQYIIKMNENTVIASYNVPEIIENLNLNNKYDFVTVDEILIKNASVPDLNLYNLAKESYKKLQAEIDVNLAEYAKQHAQKIIENENSVKKLSKIGEMLKQYPELNSLLSNASASEVLKALNDLK